MLTVFYPCRCLFFHRNLELGAAKDLKHTENDKNLQYSFISSEDIKTNPRKVVNSTTAK